MGRQVRFRCLSKSVLAFNAGDVKDRRKHVIRRRTGLWPLEILPAVKKQAPADGARSAPAGGGLNIGVSKIGWMSGLSQSGK